MFPSANSYHEASSSDRSAYAERARKTFKSLFDKIARLSPPQPCGPDRLFLQPRLVEPPGAATDQPPLVPFNQP